MSHLLVLAKAPVPGRVKTRLCPPLTAVQAADIAAASLADTLEVVAACSADRRVLALEGPVGDWLPEGFRVIPQRGLTFADRLAAAWDDVGGPGIQIGMDTPQVTPRLLDEALDSVLRPEGYASLGLAQDGGWWALGLQRPDSRVFDGIPMSASDTGSRQRERLVGLGYDVTDLPVLRDIDTVEDLVQVTRSAPGTRTARVATEFMGAEVMGAEVMGAEVRRAG
jgi:glycosyltransferase A (GT-A) superfamily protein (DUF2064 family)